MITIHQNGVPSLTNQFDFALHPLYFSTDPLEAMGFVEQMKMQVPNYVIEIAGHLVNAVKATLLGQPPL